MRAPKRLSQVSDRLADFALIRELSATSIPSQSLILPLSPHTPPDFTLEELKRKAYWIRNILHPGVAHDGAKFLDADTTLEVQDFLDRLGSSIITKNLVQESRIHKAVLDISGRATRWPSRLIDTADDILEDWTDDFGDIKELHAPLYGKGGRLHGICEPHELHRSAIVQRWLADPTTRVSQLNAWIHGHAGFTPGQWWINALFAFHCGIIDSASPWGGISADEESAYAILLTHYTEVPGETDIDMNDENWPRDTFTYRAKNNDPGRWRLMSALLPPKPPIRVLRSHTQHVDRAPSVGVRYDGLYKVVSYKFKTENNESSINFRLQREEGQTSLRKVWRHPCANEVDDYHEFRRIRDKHAEAHTAYVQLASSTARMMRMNDSLDDEPFLMLSSRSQASNQDVGRTVTPPAELKPDSRSDSDTTVHQAMGSAKLASSRRLARLHPDKETLVEGYGLAEETRQ